MATFHENIGTTTNLLYGYQSTWLSEKVGNNALFSVPRQAMNTVDIEPKQKLGNWGFPSITLNDTAENLLNNLLPYTVSDPAEFSNTAQIPAGPLLIRD
ncbi:hypothetical protein VU04_12560, partial [Desulfobulbus sp. TB]|nr:hypothetical protein [Desulfobulbus sp. TB]